MDLPDLIPNPDLAVTGHRPHKFGGAYDLTHPRWDLVRVWFSDVFEQLEPAKVYVGMALGVDQLAAQICHAMGVPFVACVPFPGQESRWPAESKRLYRELLEQASEVVTVNMGPYTAWKMHARNHFMVDRADALLAVWDGTAGGTSACVEYAQSRSRYLPVVRLSSW